VNPVPSVGERDLFVGGTGQVPREFLQSLFSLELLAPSKRLWICSAWLSDIEVIDNTARRFSSLVPSWPAAHVTMSRVFEALLERGAALVVVVNSDGHNDYMAARLQQLRRVYQELCCVRREQTIHEKGIHGDHFTVDGSMNLTYNGIFVNDEHVLFRTSAAAIAERLTALERRWGSNPCP
jgi:phosphatidylserine/phosphatidylglycerophosphate/cardiolipin synthase-like enzyme